MFLENILLTMSSKSNFSQNVRKWQIGPYNIALQYAIHRIACIEPNEHHAFSFFWALLICGMPLHFEKNVLKAIVDFGGSPLPSFYKNRDRIFLEQQNNFVIYQHLG